MTTHRKNGDPEAAKARAEAVFKKKEQQRREGESATDDYVAKQAAERNKTTRLRALRLARETRKTAKAKPKQ